MQIIEMQFVVIGLLIGTGMWVGLSYVGVTGKFDI